MSKNTRKLHDETIDTDDSDITLVDVACDLVTSPIYWVLTILSVLLLASM